MDTRKRKRTGGWLADALGAAGGIAGGAFTGDPFGAELGRRAGSWAGQFIKSYTGFGAYSINQNTLYEGAQTPFVTNANVENAMVIAHREYLGDIVTSATPGQFQAQEFVLNPCVTQSFPWLHTIANNFEEWLPMGIIFFYKTTSSDALNSTNTALGNVIMAAQYNVYQPDFTTKAQMENHAYNMSCKPSDNMLFPIECAPSQNQVILHYTRPGDNPTPAGADQRLYDLAVMTIATEGFQAASVQIGELHVAYQIAFFKPRIWEPVVIPDVQLALGQIIWTNTDTAEPNGMFDAAHFVKTDGNIVNTIRTPSKDADPDVGDYIQVTWVIDPYFVNKKLICRTTYIGDLASAAAIFLNDYISPTACTINSEQLITAGVSGTGENSDNRCIITPTGNTFTFTFVAGRTGYVAGGTWIMTLESCLVC